MADENTFSIRGKGDKWTLASDVPLSPEPVDLKCPTCGKTGLHRCGEKILTPHIHGFRWYEAPEPTDKVRVQNG